MTGVETRYHRVEQEVLAMSMSLVAFRPHLLNSPVEVETILPNLKNEISKADTSPRILRFTLTVADVPFTVIYKGQKEPVDLGKITEEEPLEQRRVDATVWIDGACLANGTERARAAIGVFWGPDDGDNVSAEFLSGTKSNQAAELQRLWR